MAGVGAPVEIGLVASFSRSGGNVTGVTDLAAELGGRPVQLLRDVVPNLACVGALGSTHEFSHCGAGALRRRLFMPRPQPEAL